MLTCYNANKAKQQKIPESVLGMVKYAILFLFRPKSHLTVMLS